MNKRTPKAEVINLSDYPTERHVEHPRSPFDKKLRGKAVVLSFRFRIGELVRLISHPDGQLLITKPGDNWRPRSRKDHNLIHLMTWPQGRRIPPVEPDTLITEEEYQTALKTKGADEKRKRTS